MLGLEMSGNLFSKLRRNPAFLVSNDLRRKSRDDVLFVMRRTMDRKSYLVVNLT